MFIFLMFMLVAAVIQGNNIAIRNNECCKHDDCRHCRHASKDPADLEGDYFEKIAKMNKKN